MGVTGIIAFLMVVLAYIAQSPRFLKRIGLAGYRLDLRVRSFTGYTLAFMLLSFGFFLAGVPLGPQLEPEPDVQIVEVTPTPKLAQTAVSDTTTTTSTDATSTGETSAPTTIVEAAPTRSSNGNETNSVSDPSPTAAGADEEPSDEESFVSEATIPAISPSDSETSSNSTATLTPTAQATPSPSPTPTETPLPTFTPTPIVGNSATIGTGTSTLWLRRTPGGQNFVLVKGGDIIILLSGHAHQGGTLWREVSTLDGTTAWVQESYLNFE